MEYAVKLTRTPAWITERDVDPLRRAGFDDRAIVDANQVVAYFNYVNRVADGLGVELEPGWPAELRAERGYRTIVRADDLPWLTVREMREIDRIATEELRVTLEQMMENAGRALAIMSASLLGGTVADREIVVLAGVGGNGGGGMVAARHLAAAGARVVVRLASPADRLAPIVRAQYEILRRIGIPVEVGRDGIGTRDLAIDALLGYSQSGPPRAGAETLIAAAAGVRTLALDVPSGLELATGELHDPHVRAEATITLAVPKTGLRAAAAAAATGDLYLADLSLPSIVYERLGVEYRSPFAGSSVVRVV